jgi:hypothetical protein
MSTVVDLLVAVALAVGQGAMIVAAVVVTASVTVAIAVTVAIPILIAVPIAIAIFLVVSAPGSRNGWWNRDNGGCHRQNGCPNELSSHTLHLSLSLLVLLEQLRDADYRRTKCDVSYLRKNVV